MNYNEAQRAVVTLEQSSVRACSYCERLFDHTFVVPTGWGETKYICDSCPLSRALADMARSPAAVIAPLEREVIAAAEAWQVAEDRCDFEDLVAKGDAETEARDRLSDAVRRLLEARGEK
jgi:hypothetical protein